MNPSPALGFDGLTFLGLNNVVVSLDAAVGVLFTGTESLNSRVFPPKTIGSVLSISLPTSLDTVRFCQENISRIHVLQVTAAR